ncbi:MAG: GIY-YIG nuclease family protein [Candidatus Nealsonbacteria bacterium]
MVAETGADWCPSRHRYMKFSYVYVLRNKAKDFIYIGYSEDLRQRVQEHNSGKSKSTKHYNPLELIHYEAYKNSKDAKRREEYLKTSRGKTTLMTMLKEYFS